MTKSRTTTPRRTLALVMTVLMLMSAWVFVAPMQAAAANEMTFVPEGNGGYVYYNYAGSGG
ncbi:MAG: hypothetical protein II804_08485, partial [Clostridia bacterium]|nr:hypothetical protein [Clostridia bacterium]